MMKWLSALVGDSNERELDKIRLIVEEINLLEPDFETLSDEELRGKTDEFRDRHSGDESLDDLLPEAFAAVREAAKRTIGQRHFDVQLIGGVVLHRGRIAEMKTGEGKTLVATLSTYLNALGGDGVHIVTVNDYLAKRDPQWMGPIYHALGITVASIQHESAFLFDPDWNVDDSALNRLRPVPRREAYAADITYGTNNEFGFDYLRDNMVTDLKQKAQRPLAYAIVDEVDNILIDEARTPLIISGQAADVTDWYRRFSTIAPRLVKEEDFTIDERTRSVSITEEGIDKVERTLNVENIYDPQNFQLVHYLENALKAHVIFARDREYIVQNGEVIIVDEFTGRLMQGRRYSEGLHQAIEAKERVQIQRESITLATITFQNYFRMYEKLAGMTGTAVTEAEEFHKIYTLDVVVIPTNQEMCRDDRTDQVYKTELAKYEAAVREIGLVHNEGRPTLVGTVSVEKSERLSGMLKREGIPHNVLNAKYHEREAAIVAEAGRPGAVTIATNMAGRGTDIILGGSPSSYVDELLKKQKIDPAEADSERLDQFEQEAQIAWQEAHDEVVRNGGLHIIGTERHEARRIDNQLRGRAGRQGDPGSSRFFVSLEDDIMRRFQGERIKGFMNWAGLEDDVPIENRIVNRSLESAQTKVEGYNFDIRKNVVEYDDVMNAQRGQIYGEREKILSGADLKSNILEMAHTEVEQVVENSLLDEHGDDWDANGLITELHTILPLPESFSAGYVERRSRTELIEELEDLVESSYEQREAEFGEENSRILERMVLLQTIDNLWVQHLTEMDAMRTGIGLRAYGQADPLVAYKREAHNMYDDLLAGIQRQVAHTIFHVAISRQTPAPQPQARNIQTNRQTDGQASANNTAAQVTSGGASREPVKAGVKVGRNAPCPCGSGKKYKRCHGAAA